MKAIGEQSLYEILEIPQDAPVEEIEDAYRRAKALYGPGSLATYSLVAPEEMALLNRRIEEARRVLLDAGARAGYDATLPGAASRAAASPPSGEPQAPSSAAARPIPAAEATPPPSGGAVGAQPGRAAAARAEPPASAPAAPAPIATPGPAAPISPPPLAPATTPAPAPAEVSPPAPAAQGAPPAAAPAPRAPAFSVPEGAAWTGEMLRQAREGRGLTLHQVAERTKVARHHLENVEADRYPLLPAPVYLRGILISLAKELRLDPQKVSRSYLEAMQAAQAEPAPAKPR